MSGSGAWPAAGTPPARDEDELVRRLAEIAGPSGGGILVGIGDDAAVLRAPPGEDLVWTVDGQEEDVDFRRAWLTLEEVGGRAVAAALSDLAGMAARPIGVLLALGSAGEARAAELLALFRGAADAARRWGAPVAGGDLTRRERGVGVTVTALGAVEPGRALRRDGARAGDEIWVTGAPGRAAAGLRLLRDHGRVEAERRDPAAVAAFAAPAPRLAEARWLAERAAPRAGMDLSDGLARDLPRLCAASGVGALLEEELLREAAHDPGDDGLAAALAGGEDFELLLATACGALEPLAGEFVRLFGGGLHRVGAIVPGAGVRLRSGARTWHLAPSGFDHLDGTAASGA